MNILHYTIGIPPTRHGGSVQYAYDLMLEQSKHHNVFALICGDTLFRNKIARIHRVDKVAKINIYSLTNPLTPTLIYGTSAPEKQYRPINFDKDNIKEFIFNNKINVMHLHTLMGIHKDIVEYIKSLGVKIVYTTHDFHGLCLHYNLINEKGAICTRISSEACMNCNQREPSDLFLRLVNSSFYHLLKKIGISKFKNRVPISTSGNRTLPVDCDTDSRKNPQLQLAYDDLLKYYKEYFAIIDKIHFNSTQTKEVFKSFLPWIDGKVIPVMTESIKDCRKELNPKGNVTFGFVGSLNDYKGFPLLKEVLLELKDEGYENFHLNVFSGSHQGFDRDCELIEYKPPYNKSTISQTFYEIDCFIVPSKWYETFSLVTVEALAHGRPVIVSDHVGAKDFVKNVSPELIFSTKEDLKGILKSILENPSILKEANKKISSIPWEWSIETNAKALVEYYREEEETFR